MSWEFLFIILHWNAFVYLPSVLGSFTDRIWKRESTCEIRGSEDYVNEYFSDLECETV